MRFIGKFKLFLIGKAFYATDIATPSLSLEMSTNLFPPTEIGDLI